MGAEKKSGAGKRIRWIAGLAIVLAILAAYAATFHAPFVFDDRPAILENPTLRSLGSAWSPPPGGLPVSGRPLVNVTLALNYAVSGTQVWSYHAFNLGLHMLAALTLFGLVRRTLAMRHRGPTDASSTLLAAAAGLLWGLHPLQTEAVTYVAQRAEVLAALFYLLTLYTFVRGRDSVRAGWWRSGSVFCCLLGMASKETMVTAPVVVLLYDAVFLSGGFRAAWQRHGKIYLGYAATWLLLAWLVLSTARRGGTAGFGLNITPWAYLQTQAEAIARYLGLTFWPDPLVFDYGTYLTQDFAVVALCGALIVLLLAGVVLVWRRWPVAGFLGVCFFLILAPSSSFVPVATQTIAEHRMYLPLAALVVAVVIGARRWLGRAAWPVLAVMALGLGAMTVARNADYSSEFSLWRDTVAKRPGNYRARYNLALQWLEQGKPDAALAEVRAAARLDPQNPDAHFNLSLILLRTGKAAEAVTAAETSLRLRPGASDVRVALGNALMETGRLDEALAQFSRAVELEPASFSAHNNLGVAAARAGRFDLALRHDAEAVRLRPESAEAHRNLAEALRQSGQIDEAISEARRALPLNPSSPEAHYTLGAALLQKGQLPAAMQEINEALRLRPGYADAHLLLGAALLQAGRIDEGLRYYTEALRLAPDSFETHFNYGNALMRLGRLDAAAEQYEAVIRLRPALAKAYFNLGYIRLQQEKFEEAAREFKIVLQIDPANNDARFNLANMLLQDGHLEAAATELSEVLRRQPAAPEVQCLLGNVLMALKRPAEAATHFAEAVRLKPDYAEARENLALARAAAGRR